MNLSTFLVHCSSWRQTHSTKTYRKVTKWDTHPMRRMKMSTLWYIKNIVVSPSVFVTVLFFVLLPRQQLLLRPNTAGFLCCHFSCLQCFTLEPFFVFLSLWPISWGGRSIYSVHVSYTDSFLSQCLFTFRKHCATLIKWFYYRAIRVMLKL